MKKFYWKSQKSKTSMFLISDINANEGDIPYPTKSLKLIFTRELYYGMSGICEINLRQVLIKIYQASSIDDHFLENLYSIR